MERGEGGVGRGKRRQWNSKGICDFGYVKVQKARRKPHFKINDKVKNQLK